MSYEEKILQFLAKPENLPVAFEVAEYLQKLKEFTHQMFWSNFSEAMTVRMEDSLYNDKWEFAPISEENWNRQWEIGAIRPKGQLDPDKPVLQVGIQQGSIANLFWLLVGVNWTPQPAKEYNVPSFEELQAQLNALNWKGYLVFNERPTDR